MKLGSLFDGSGGFPLAGSINGIEPVWACEIEPFPVRVTKARFPQMKHLGDVTKIDGAEIEPVDIVTFGSPCQDLSIAGKQKGIHEGERSNLFFEAVRIIKEMRENDRAAGRTGKYIRPRWAVWENVPGAFSSNGGKDFQAVLQALAEIAEPDVVIPRPEKWNKPGCIVGRGWSIAWRILDAQYWGVPQRRRRIYLVADFADERAGEILFEREGVRGYFETGRKTREGVAGDDEGGAGADDREGGSNCVTNWDVQSRRLYTPDGSWPSLYGGEGGGHGYVVTTAGDRGRGLARLMGAYQHHGWRENDVCGTLTAGQNDTVRGDTPLACLPAVANTLTARADGSPQPDKKSGANVVVQGVVDTCQNTGSKQQSLVTSENKENTLGANDYKEPKIAVYAMQAFGLYKESEVASSLKQRDYKDATDLICGVDCRNLTEHPELYPTLQAHSGGGYSINYSGAIRVQYIVRRLTPNECARLQGFPDWWDADVEGSDSARYKMWGNGIALPCAEFVLRRIAEFVRIERMGW